MHILTDFPRFPEYTLLADKSEVTATTMLAFSSKKDFLRILRHIRRADVILVQDSVKVLGFALLFSIFPFLKKPIIAVDLILRAPHTPKQKLIAHLKRKLLRRVDHFIHYFKMLEGYTTYYGISYDRSSYVPFKSNMRANPKVAGIQVVDTEEYVFSAGRSLRDYDTLFEALSQLPYPAAIPQPNFEQLHRHGSRFTWALDRLPKNLVLLEDDGSPESWTRNLHRAKIVIIPTLHDSLCASGIGTYLDAMAMKKCVVISQGPGVSDLLQDEVVTVPPENPTALAKTIQKLWEDSTLRTATAIRGYQYASALGAEPDLMKRLLNQTLRWYKARTIA